MAKITINGIISDPVETEAHAVAFKAVARKLQRADHVLIQTDGPLRKEQRQELIDAGVELLEFVPEHTFIGRLKSHNLDRVRKLSFVKWAGSYLHGFKVNRGLMDAPPPREVGLEHMVRSESGEHTLAQWGKPVQVDIVLHRGLSAEDVREEVAQAAGVSSRSLKKVSARKIRLTVQPQRLNMIAALPHVRHIEKVYEPSLWNNVAGGIIGAQEVHEGDSGFRGQGQVVAVADTGFDKGSTEDVHPAFGKRVRKLYPLGRPDTKDANDSDGHGTHVAGSVLGDGEFGPEKIKITGTAPSAELVLQSLDASTEDQSSLLGGLPHDLANLFRPPYENDGARVHSNSWGFSQKELQGTYTQMSSEVDEFIWTHRDLVICIAAGNQGEDSDGNGIIDRGSVQPPGTAKNCITVGASESVRPEQSKEWGDRFAWPKKYPADPIKKALWAMDANSVAAFSSTGPTKDSRIKPDVVAPGTSILSACSRDLEYPSDFWGKSPDPLYLYNGGTSMATPLVSGCAAVVREYLAEVHKLPNPSAALVKAILINGAVNLIEQSAAAQTSVLSDTSQGFGRVNLKNSLVLSGGSETLEVHDENRALDGHAEKQSFKIAIPPGMARLKVTLVWTDFPGEHLVNDLDLIVAARTEERHGNMLPASKDFDRSNNVEQVVWAEPPTGTCDVQVYAHNVPLHPQSFALVIRTTPKF